MFDWERLPEDCSGPSTRPKEDQPEPEEEQADYKEDQPEDDLEEDMARGSGSHRRSPSGSESDSPSRAATGPAQPVVHASDRVLATTPPASFMNTFLEFAPLANRTPEYLVNEPWAGVMSSVLQTIEGYLDMAVTTPHPGAFLLTKNLNLYQIEVETSVTVHPSIPVMQTAPGSDPHVMSVNGRGTSTQTACVLEESVDSLYGQEAIILRFKYAFPMSAQDRAPSQLRFYIDPKEDDEDKGRYLIDVDANGCYAFRNDSFLSLLSYHARLPHGDL